ncbi:hypothetical protein [Curtobacterium sp. PhB130]|uniref:hypothetical protein n=1 Tax=Curtobacterium sp. PhB130 TaxID=2485178 RepID=UPI0016143A5B|nr:hypothetical protein [Curtobacterium sp. PhB130]
MSVTQRVGEGSGAALLMLPRLSPDAILGAAGVLATLIVAIQFGARLNRSPSTTGQLDEAARGSFLWIVALVCLVGSIALALATTSWYGWHDNGLDVPIVLSALSGGALLAFASADAMLLTEHDLDGHVSRLQGRRAWIRARAVVVFERSRPLEGPRLRVALVATSAGLPLISTGLSEMVSPSRGAAEVVGRFALMTGGAALSGIAVFAMLALFMSRQIFSGVIVSLGVVSLIILAWDVALYDSAGGTVRSVERMAQLWLAYPMLAVSMPLIVFGLGAGSWKGRRGLILEWAVRHFVRRERMLRLSQESVNPTSHQRRLSGYAVAAIWTSPILPLCAFFAARAFYEIRSTSGMRGTIRTMVAIIVSIIISVLFVGALVVAAAGGF